MVKNKGLVKFHLLQPFHFRDRNKARARIQKLMALEGKPFNLIDFIFCSDEYLLDINEKFLHHNDLTDVITFNLSENKSAIQGEIYISVDRVRENSKLYRISFDSELKRVMFHGALHLCGYKDKKSKEKQEMTEKEDYYLKRL